MHSEIEGGSLSFFSKNRIILNYLYRLVRKHLRIRMELFQSIPDDLIFHMFIYGKLWNADAVSCALISRRFHAAFVMARKMSFDFLVHSYASSNLLFRQKLVETWFFQLDCVPAISVAITKELLARDSDFIQDLRADIRFFECWNNINHDEFGRTSLPKYDEVEEAHRIPNLDPSRDIRLLIVGLVDSISHSERIQKLVERVQTNFKLPLDHLRSNCNIDIRYHSSASDERPFYSICFHVQLVYNRKSYVVLQRRKYFTPNIEVIGCFMEAHTVSTLATYISKLLSMPNLEEFRDYYIVRTCHPILYGTSIVPTWEEVSEKQESTLAKVQESGL